MENIENVPNIFLYGIPNSGKSAFVNSSFSLLHSKLIYDIALTGNSSLFKLTMFSGGSASKPFNLKSYRLSCMETSKPTAFRLWDSCGIASNIEDIVYGR